MSFCSADAVRTSCAGWMLNVISKVLHQKIKIALKPLDLNVGQFAILMILLESEGVSQSTIGRLTSLPGYATTRNIDALEKRGLIKRHPDENSRRSLCIHLTQQGRELEQALHDIVLSVNADLLSPLNDTDARQLSFLLAKLVSGHGCSREADD